MRPQIMFLGSGRRAVVGNRQPDRTDYRFRVTSGQRSTTVAVGITGQWHDTPEAMGSRALSEAQLKEAAEAWLRSQLEKGKCDPFNRPQTDTMLDMPSEVIEYWEEHHSIPCLP